MIAVMPLLLRLSFLLCLMTSLLSAGERRILFLGDSITAAYGLPEKQGYTALLQKKLVELSPDWKVVNAGVSGDTTAGGVRRVTWLLKQPAPSVFVIALGGNDGLRKTPVAEVEKNLQAIVDKARTFQPQPVIILAGMRMPSNFGSYGAEFSEVYERVAERNKIVLHPFLLEGVALNPELNQGDMIHPNAKGQELIAKNLWKTLQPIVSKTK